MRTSPVAGLDDAVLAGQARAGDDVAYGELVRRHQERLYRHARGMGLDHDPALDAVQDAFVRAHDRLDECRTPGHFRAWVYRICHNRCLDHLKDVRRQELPLDAAQASADQGPADDPELRLTLRTALARLSPALREAFLLRHQAGYDYDEIASLLQVSPSAAKMRVHRAREALQAFLVSEGVGATGH